MFKRGDFVAFCGYLGAGKTMTAFMLAQMYHQAGWPVVSNVDSSAFAGRYTRARTYSDLFLTPRNSLVIADEAGILLDARSFSSDINKNITKLLYLMRKRGNIFFYTVQSLQFADNRVRELTRYVFFCEPVQQGYSIARFAIYDGFQSATLRGSLTVQHSLYYGLYNSFDDEVSLVDDISNPKPDRNRPRDNNAASTEARASVR